MVSVGGGETVRQPNQASDESDERGNNLVFYLKRQ
jgi:hypothetical protein